MLLLPYLVVCPLIATKANITQTMPMGSFVPFQIPGRVIPGQLSSKKINRCRDFFMMAEIFEDLRISKVKEQQQARRRKVRTIF